MIIEPKNSDRVFVDVTAYNSRFYYIEGEVNAPGRLPFTGGEQVLDVIHFAGGVRLTADTSKIRLIRSYPKGSPVQVLPIDYDEITMGTDASTNYQILPGDRIVVPRIWGKPGAPSKPAAGGGSPSPDQSQSNTAALRYGNREAPGLYFPAGGNDPRDESGRLENSKLEKRMQQMEKKLDTLLEKLGKAQPTAAAGKTAQRGDQLLPEPVDEKAEPQPRRQPQ